jgi:hypothetical protein
MPLESVTALLRESVGATVDGIAPAFVELRGDPIPDVTLDACKNLLVAAFATGMHVGEGAVTDEQKEAVVDAGRRVREMDGASYLLDTCGLYLLRKETRDETLLVIFMTCVFSSAFRQSVADPRCAGDYGEEPAYLAIRALWADKIGPRRVQDHSGEQADRTQA